MKAKRQAKILELIASREISTQEELMRLLSAAGFAVTQATVSRDIRELKLVKYQSSNGAYRYATARKDQPSGALQRFNTIMGEAVTAVDSAQNIVVVKCHTGMANAACEVLDAVDMGDIVGTLAGDNTFLIIMRNEEEAKKIARKIAKFATGR